MTREYTSVQLKKEISKAIRGLQNYDIKCGVFVSYDSYFNSYSYDLCVTTWNGSGSEIILDLYVATIESQEELEEKNLESLFKELEKTYKYLARNFSNIEKLNGVIG